jgi:hypothetical protein
VLVARWRHKGLGGGTRHYSHGLNGPRREQKTGRENWLAAMRGSKIEKRKRNGVGRLEAFGPKQPQEKERSFLFSILNLL